MAADSFFVAGGPSGLNPTYGFYNQSGGTFTDFNGGNQARFRIAASNASNVGLAITYPAAHRRWQFLVSLARAVRRVSIWRQPEPARPPAARRSASFISQALDR